jgi:1,2-diacylglycerol 3-alpha-glucosyltransferase
MRIALFSDLYKPQLNGVVHHVSLLKQYLERWGEDVYLFVPGTRKQADDEQNVVRIPGIPIADTGYHLSIRLNRESRAILAEMDIVHVHQPFISGSFGLYCQSHYAMPLVFTNHTRYDLYVKAYLPLLPNVLSETALQAYFQGFSRRCAALIAPSPSIAQVMKRWGVEGRIAVIPNGIELERFYTPQNTISRAELQIPADAVIAVYVGRMGPEKNLERLLQIFSRTMQQAPHVHLLLVGDGPELDDLQRLARRLSIAQRVTFTGQVDYAAIPGYLRLADFFVSASVTEVHPLTFIEATAAGLPALGIHSTGVVDIIRDGENGYVSPDRDEEFQQRFVRLAHDTQLRQRMGEQARHISRDYSAQTNARRILDLYEDVWRATSASAAASTTRK